ncbi:MAG: hypothetical protein A2046_02205 [Bacteroidetes bacterium GWA2_30_7]|nr:MAG: hypothetical protein A2046_02205 [Bacteroidetes bacterium GWA2_30_7]
MKPDYKAWFVKAESDLLNVKNNINANEIPYDTLCFHSQQIAEKYLKGYLTKNSIEFEKTHNLIFLLEKCIEINSAFEQIREYLLVLNQYSSLSRYPDFAFEPDESDANEAFQFAKKVKEFVLKML